MFPLDDTSQHNDCDHDLKAQKYEKYADVGENNDHMTDSVPDNIHVPSPEEDQDSDKSYDNEDSTIGSTASKREKTYVVSKESKDSEDSGDSEDTISKDDENLENAIPKSKEETNNEVDTLQPSLIHP